MRAAKQPILLLVVPIATPFASSRSTSYFDLKCKNSFNSLHNLFDVWVEKPSEAKTGAYDSENVYEGCITDVSRDGTVDYRGRPVDKSKYGGWKGVSFIMGEQAKALTPPWFW